jgi:heme exporter protein B
VIRHGKGSSPRLRRGREAKGEHAASRHARETAEAAGAPDPLRRSSPRAARQLRALVLKDLRLELRTRDTLAAMALFALIAMVIFEFAVGSRTDDLTPFAGGILWATLALTAVLAVGRSWVPEREQRVLDGLLAAPVPRLVLLAARTIAIWLYMAAVELLAVPLAVVLFVEEPEAADLGWTALVCLLADLGIGVLGALFASMAVFARARELLLPVLFLPSLLPVVIAAAGATHAVTGGPNDLAEYRGYCMFLGVYAVIFGLVAYATYEYVFDD